MPLSKPREMILVAALLVASIVAVSLVRAASAAPSGSGYEISWYTVDGGGGTSTGGAYSLDGTLGQPDAGTLQGGGYTVAGGFWAGLAAAVFELFLPLISR